jgi:hypothetical protein
MKAVTGQAFESEVIKLAEELIAVCNKHTSSIGQARAALQIADAAIAARQFAEEPALSEPTQ